MAGYDEDFWGEDFLEGEEGATEGEEGTEGIVADVGLDHEERTSDRRLGEATNEGNVLAVSEAEQGKRPTMQAARAESLRTMTRGSALSFWHALRRKRKSVWMRALQGSLRGF